MGIVFWLTFNVIGAGLQSLLETGIGYLTEITDQAMTSAGVNTAVHSLVIDGIFNGVGGVLSFLPIIVTLFFFLSLLEDSGYMARVAFIMDKLLRKLGLSGRSIVPMLVGFGCTVPRGDGEQNASVGKRQENDDFADSVYELYGKASDLCILFGCIFSGLCRACDDRIVCSWYCYGNYHGPFV